MFREELPRKKAENKKKKYQNSKTPLKKCRKTSFFLKKTWFPRILKKIFKENVNK